MPPIRPERRSPQDRVIPRRIILPEPEPLRLPNGWYDPDSAAFDERKPSDVEELFRSTSPADPSELRPVAS